MMELLADHELVKLFPTKQLSKEMVTMDEQFIVKSPLWAKHFRLFVLLMTNLVHEVY